jgi:cyclophilin family peptidyl-prolyl cis-trans isomerase
MHITGWQHGTRIKTWPWQIMFRSQQVSAPVVPQYALGCRGGAWSLLVVAIIAGCGSPNSPTSTGEGDSEGPAATQSVTRSSTDTTASVVPPTALPETHSEGPPKVLISTSLGEITVELDREHAPLTTHNFLTYANAKHYDQTIFHFVQPGEMILGGGFTADLNEKPTSEPIRNEAHNGLRNRRGSIAMSRSPESIDSAICQFFINLADNQKLDFRDRTPAGYGYCVFGHVVAGMDVVDRIAATPTGDQGDFVSVPVTPVVIESVRLLP